MLGSVLMQLQRQAPSLFYYDALDLIALTEIERLVSSPRPVNFPLILCQRWRDLPEPLRDPAQPVGALPVRNQHCVVSSHHDDIINTEKRDMLLFACDIGAPRVDEDRRTLRGVAVRVALGQFPNRLPRPHIRP